MIYFYSILFIILVSIYGYIIGSVSFARLIANIKGIDITSVGSSNPGGTNVWRTLGWKYGLLCMLADAVKGFVATFPILCIVLLIPNINNGEIFYPFFVSNYNHLNFYALTAGLFACLGHSYPIFYKFKGGKNVMVFAGVIIATSPQLFLLALLMFLIILFISREVAPASLTAALTIILGSLIPVILYSLNINGCQFLGIYFNENSFFVFDWLAYLFYLASSFLVIFRHKKNINLIVHHEDKHDF